MSHQNVYQILGLRPNVKYSLKHLAYPLPEFLQGRVSPIFGIYFRPLVTFAFACFLLLPSLLVGAMAG